MKETERQVGFGTPISIILILLILTRDKRNSFNDALFLTESWVNDSQRKLKKKRRADPLLRVVEAEQKRDFFFFNKENL